MMCALPGMARKTTNAAWMEAAYCLETMWSVAGTFRLVSCLRFSLISELYGGFSELD
jgi:hypothetical protein